MARTPRTERPVAAQSGATDIGTYGITPAAAMVPAALALGVTPALAADDAPVAAGAPAGGTAHAAPLAPAVDAQGGSPFAAALGPPAFLFDAAGAITSTMRAAAADSGQAARQAAEPAEQQDAPPAAGGSGTPPGLLQVDRAGPPAVSEIEETAGAAGVTAPGGVGLQSGLDAVDARIEGMRVSIGEQLEQVAVRIDAIEAGTGAIVAEVEDAVSDAVDGALGRVSDVEDAVADTLDAASARIADVGQVASGLADSLPQIDLGPVGGADPAGGISTLVGMVSAADMFGLHDIGAGGAGDVLSPIVGGANDSGLTDFVPADVLLAVPDHDNAFGLLDGLIDGHHG
ncbi:hypothetical protein D1610_07810 [Sphingomonas gilva]|uniref:Uncharacterized protein n=1 Tax=Sphingomonas gilva TaxID=2305907 RepID=A0A396RP90_9SPHN|nr:hypothetical protein [Sphingomonas gilva]RHW18357.1 hypothetical protein D1610_07810 [Sphingomonas gilva]